MILAEPVGIAGVATWLPARRESARDAVDDLRLSAEDLDVADYETLPVSLEHSAPDMAALAARRALESAGAAGEDVAVLAHAWTYHQGHDFWSPAHYVAREVGACGAIPVGIQQMCNGSAAGVEAVVARLLLEDDPQGVGVACSADRFGAPGFDRWSGDYGLWYGDGAAAAVLRGGARPGDALELLALQSTAAPDMEDMHRGEDSFSVVPRETGETVDVRRTKKAFLAAGRMDAFVAAVHERVGAVLSGCLRAACVRPDDRALRCVTLPRLGAKARGPYTAAVAAVTPAPALDLGTHTGHLGAGDFLANLAELAGGPTALAPGEMALVLSAGAGFTWSAALVRRGHHPTLEGAS